MLKHRPGIKLRYKRDPEGTTNWLEGFFSAICEQWSDEVAIVALLEMVGADFPTSGLPVNVIETMRNVIFERKPE